MCVASFLRQLSFTTPVLACPDLWANISAISQHRDLTNFISAHEGQHMLRSALMYSAPGGTRHELAYEASHRHFHHISPEASVSYVYCHSPLASAV